MKIIINLNDDRGVGNQCFQDSRVASVFSFQDPNIGVIIRLVEVSGPKSRFVGLSWPIDFVGGEEECIMLASGSVHLDIVMYHDIERSFVIGPNNRSPYG